MLKGNKWLTTNVAHQLDKYKRIDHIIKKGKQDMQLQLTQYSYLKIVGNALTWTTLTTNTREKGSMAATRRSDIPVRKWANIPGPSSQAATCQLLRIILVC